MAAVARSAGGGRLVPSLGLESQQVSKKPRVTTNDEVASILKGLQLDRKFFVSRLDESQCKDLLPVADAPGEADASPDSKRIVRMKTKVLKKNTVRVATKKQSDFDIYLGEALMPVLAQALDSLCRQVNRMQAQGDSLDPKVRARFNPLTWLAQQLIRRHPRGAKTPRRQAIYANFRDWSDLERGRREMLRRRDVVQDVFEGFVLRGVVQRRDLSAALDAVDDTMRLGGILSNNKAVRSALSLEDNEPRPESPTTRQKQQRRTRDDFFNQGGWNFEQFWTKLATVIVENDVVPFSAIQRGIDAAHQQALVRSEAEDIRKKEEEERRQADLDQKRMLEEYTSIHKELQEQEHIKAILESGKVLTGDDVRPGDAGYEFEVPPNGPHVTMLAKLLVLLGFESLDKTKEKPRTASPAGDAKGLPEMATQLSSGAADAAPGTAAPAAGERWWDDELASAWTTLQEFYRAEIADGVVEQEVLEKVLVPPAGYQTQRSKIMEELESREEKDDLDRDRPSRRNSEAGAEDLVRQASKKPSIDSLCEALGITMSRMEWLHRLFESFLQPDEKNPGVVPVCLYPDAPAAIKKVQMKALMKELRPNMEEVEFEARFRRIDQDLSGQVEFDEFVQWVREDEVRVAGAAPLQKMSFEDLATVYSESVELIKYLHERFQEAFPDGEADDYPSNPKPLGKAEVRALVSSLTPSMSDAEFETQFQMTTFSKKDTLEFDEFLEVVPLDELPDEIRGD